MFNGPDKHVGDGPLSRKLAGAHRQRKRALQKSYACSALSEFGPDQMVAEILDQFRQASPEQHPISEVAEELAAGLALASGIYHDHWSLPEPRNTADRIRKAHLLDELSALIQDGAFALDLVIETTCQMLEKLMPPVGQSKHRTPGTISFDIANLDLMPCPAALILSIVDKLRGAQAVAMERGYSLFSQPLDAIERQVKRTAGLPENAPWPKGTNPQAELEKQLSKPHSPEDILRKYLSQTPFLALFSGRTSLSVSPGERVEHMHILAPSGAGKTRTLEHLITQDLSAVSKGKASVLVMESEGGLISRLARHAYCDPHHSCSIRSRVTLIDPGQPGRMPEFSLFGIVGSNLKEASPIERETITNSVTDLYRYVFRALRGGELTERQGYIFNKLIQMLVWVEGASFETLLKCLKNTDEAARLSANAPGALAEFFASEYPLKTYQPTRTELYQRLDTFRSSAETLNRMLSGVVSNYDLESDLGGGRLVLINTNKEVLGEEGSRVFGRFIIALIRLLSFRRTEQSTPLFLYIDEAYEYIDEKITALFRQGRKRQIGIIVAHQELAQLDMISAETRHAIQTNTQIKLAGNSDYRDRVEMARNMGGTGPEFFTKLRKKHHDYSEFALFIRNQTPVGAVKARIPLGTLERLRFLDTLPEPHWPCPEFRPPASVSPQSGSIAQTRERGEWIDPWAN